MNRWEQLWVIAGLVVTMLLKIVSRKYADGRSKKTVADRAGENVERLPDGFTT